MTHPVLASLQPCEFQFSHLKEIIARLPHRDSVHTSSVHSENIARNSMLIFTPKNAFQIFVRTAKHFPEAPLKLLNQQTAGCDNLQLQMV